ncbi:hypothetical protein ACF3N7_06075 [Cruoricaptor ignavus]|uniref:SRPBCC family protein n=1 Tax=Cruoricaptor ignavus TaxID=1118202 RepID=UPI00370D997E
MNISVEKQSGIYILRSVQVLPVGLDEAWDFFSNPKNLDRITPPDMAFQITNNPPDFTYAGQIITYKIGIFPQVKSSWVTEITQLDERRFFVDEQRFGPYAMWHHEHHFREISSGRIEMQDIVSFKLPLGFLGDLIAGKAVVHRVRYIFENRYRVLRQIFPD